MNFEKSYNTNNVAIKQKQYIINSRKDIIIESEIIRGLKIKIPIISSNMLDVTNADFAIKMYKLGGLGILHRAFADIYNYLDETKKIAREIPVVAVSIGINNSENSGCNDFRLADDLIKAGANLICIDIAHCFGKNTLKICKFLKEHHPTIKIIVGNTVNPDAIEFFNDYADAIKIGCASGAACETKNTSGVYKPQFSAIYDMREKAQKYGMPLISDGGLREPADFTKLIGAGASSCMAGYIFVRCPESAAEIVEVDGIKKKIYSGMASRAIQEKWHGKVHNNCPEGKTLFVDLGESVNDLINRYEGALRSGISYSGCNNIDDFRKSCEFILI